MEHKKAKPFLSIDKQIELLKSKRLEIINQKSLEKYLILYGYQTLVNGYNDPLMVDFNRHNDMYREGATSEQLIGLFNFDRTISTYIFSNLQNFERRFTTAMINAIGSELDNFNIHDSTLFSIQDSETWNHFFTSNFENADRDQGDRAGIRTQWQRFFNKNKNVNLIKGYESVNSCPLYCLLLLATFGDKIDLYNSLQPEIQYKIRFSTFQQVELPNNEIVRSGIVFKSVLREFKKLRNRCVHANVVYNFGSKILEKKLKQYAEDQLGISKGLIKAFHLSKLLDIFLNQDSEVRISNRLCFLISTKLETFKEKYKWDDLTTLYLIRKLGMA